MVGGKKSPNSVELRLLSAVFRKNAYFLSWLFRKDFT